MAENGQRATTTVLDPRTADFYRSALRALVDAGVPFLVGGAYSLERYVGIARHTKDFDLFVRPRDCERALDALQAMGCATDLTFSHWLGKAFRGDDFIDVIFSSGNGLAPGGDTTQQQSAPAHVAAPDELEREREAVAEHP